MLTIPIAATTTIAATKWKRKTKKDLNEEGPSRMLSKNVYKTKWHKKEFLNKIKKFFDL